MTYIKHAWDATNTWWGKVSLVLFYVWIWALIVMSVYSLFDPLSGMDCLFDMGNKHVDDEMDIAAVLSRGLNLYLVCFLFYADKAGLHSSNVGFVGGVTIVWWWIWMMFLRGVTDTTACAGMWTDYAWVWPAWIVLTFITVLIDERMGTSSTAVNGTADERRALN
jgi:hypothetical protein